MQIIQITTKEAPRYHRGSKSSSYWDIFTTEFDKIAFEADVQKNDTSYLGIEKPGYKTYIENYNSFKQAYKKKYKSIPTYLIQKITGFITHTHPTS